MASKLVPQGDMPRAYAPGAVEERIYKFWNDNGYFTPEIDRSKKPFTIIMPPPNVTGELHMGHALTIALEDLMIRWHRMLGEPSLYLPGTDHAGHRHAGRGGAADSLRWPEQARPRTRQVHRARLVLGGRLRRPHLPSDRKPGRFLRLDAPRLHPRRRAGQGGPNHIRQSVQEGPHLQGQPHHQLVPALPNRAVRPGSEVPGRERPPVPHPVRDSGRFWSRRHRHHSPRNDAWRHRRRGQSQTTNATPRS